MQITATATLHGNRTDRTPWGCIKPLQWLVAALCDRHTDCNAMSSLSSCSDTHFMFCSGIVRCTANDAGADFTFNNFDGLKLNGLFYYLKIQN